MDIYAITPTCARLTVMRWLMLTITFLLGGCGTYVVNAQQSDDEFQVTREFTAPIPVRTAYRVVKERLWDCLEAYHYRVRGELDDDGHGAQIWVVTDIGVSRVLSFASTTIMKYTIQARDDGSHIIVQQHSIHSSRFARASKRWVNEDFNGCRA